MGEIPEIQTEKLSLRPFHPIDAIELTGILHTPGILRYFPSDNPPSLEKVKKLLVKHRQHWELHGFGWWAIWTRTSPRLIGWCGLNFLNETEEIELKYLLDRGFWGRGLATEAAFQSVHFGFETCDLEEIIGVVHPEHLASQRVLEKVGMVRGDEVEYFGMSCVRYSIKNDQSIINADETEEQP